jgi:signal transduction histidine kinase
MAPGNDTTQLSEMARLLAQREADVGALRAELDETNKGVVALYAELDDKAQQLQQALDLKSRFLSYMSHEFRTPLTSITSLTNILLSRLDGPLTGEQERQVGFVRSSVLELSEMVDDLLDLAKVEAGRISISPEWFDMMDLFAALRGMFKPIISGTSVALIFDEPRSVPRLYTDDKKLSQILRN